MKPTMRALHHAYATMNGYFWLPCPVCGEPFGGHEWADVDGLPSSVPVLGSTTERRGICTACTVQGYGYPYVGEW